MVRLLRDRRSLHFKWKTAGAAPLRIKVFTFLMSLSSVIRAEKAGDKLMIGYVKNSV